MRFRRLRFGSACAASLGTWVVGAAPFVSAAPGHVLVPLSPQQGQVCSETSKLVYDSGAGYWLACTGRGRWEQTVTPVGVNRVGEPCNHARVGDVLSMSPDKYLIWCNPMQGVWSIFHE